MDTGAAVVIVAVFVDTLTLSSMILVRHPLLFMAFTTIQIWEYMDILPHGTPRMEALRQCYLPKGSM